jgi:hypothetical protein
LSDGTDGRLNTNLHTRARGKPWNPVHLSKVVIVQKDVQPTERGAGFPGFLHLSLVDPYQVLVPTQLSLQSRLDIFGLPPPMSLAFEQDILDLLSPFLQ